MHEGVQLGEPPKVVSILNYSESVMSGGKTTYLSMLELIKVCLCNPGSLLPYL